jgi:hypothetical protein
MTEHHHDPAGTRSDEPDNLTERATTPGEHEPSAKAAPGTYEATPEDQERGKAVKPGN